MGFSEEGRENVTRKVTQTQYVAGAQEMSGRGRQWAWLGSDWRTCMREHGLHWVIWMNRWAHERVEG